MPDNVPSPSRYLEVERKFDVGESTSSPSFAGLADILRVERLPTQSLDAVYFDTPARGAWRDKLNSDCSWVEEPAPGSSMYHITCAVTELIETAEAGALPATE